jgi:hypothetical protein
MSIVFMPRTQSISLRRSLVGGSHHRASTYWAQGLAMLGELHRGAHYRRGARVMNWKSWDYWKSYNWTWELLHPVSRWALLCLSLSLLCLIASSLVREAAMMLHMWCP